MAQSDTHRSEIARLLRKGADLAKDLAKHREVATRASATASRKRTEAARTSSEATRRSALATVEREDRKSVDAARRAGDIEKKIADNTTAIAGRERQLTSALAAEQRTRDRDDARRRQTEKTHAQQLARIGRPTHEVRYVHVRPPEPEPLRVLYLTANPEAVETTVEHPDGSVEISGVWLRMDREVRQVNNRLKSTRYRDLVSLVHLPAATRDDLQDGLNEHRPHVVHFSGHANSLGLLLEDETGTTQGRGLDFTLLARLLGATDTPPRLLVLNACESLAGAEPLLQTVPAVVAMSDSTDDASAVVFAERFYAGIASAQSVGSSLEQAKVAMEAASLAGAVVPEARARGDVDLSSFVLVDPPGR